MKYSHYDIWVNGIFKGFVVVGHEHGALDKAVKDSLGIEPDGYEAFQWGKN